MSQRSNHLNRARPYQRRAQRSAVAGGMLLHLSDETRGAQERCAPCGCLAAPAPGRPPPTPQMLRCACGVGAPDDRQIGTGTGRWWRARGCVLRGRLTQVGAASSPLPLSCPPSLTLRVSRSLSLSPALRVRCAGRAGCLTPHRASAAAGHVSSSRPPASPSSPSPLARARRLLPPPLDGRSRGSAVGHAAAAKRKEAQK